MSLLLTNARERREEKKKKKKLKPEQNAAPSRRHGKGRGRVRWDPRPSRCVPKQRAGRAQHPLPVRCWGLLPLTESLEAICLLKKSVGALRRGGETGCDSPPSSLSDTVCKKQTSFAQTAAVLRRAGQVCASCGLTALLVVLPPLPSGNFYSLRSFLDLLPLLFSEMPIF